jgi:hypothetical protein
LERYPRIQTAALPCLHTTASPSNTAHKSLSFSDRLGRLRL